MGRSSRRWYAPALESLRDWPGLQTVLAVEIIRHVHGSGKIPSSMFAIIRTRWQTRPLSPRAKRRSSADPGSLRKKYAGIVHTSKVVHSSNHSTTSGDHQKPVLLVCGYRDDRDSPLHSGIGDRE